MASYKSSSFLQSFKSDSPIASASIARDLSEYQQDHEHALDDEDSSDSGDASISTVINVGPSSVGQGAGDTSNLSHALSRSMRRQSQTAAGPLSTQIPHQASLEPRDKLTKQERDEIIQAERSLLRDNKLIPPKHPLKEKKSGPLKGKLGIPRIGDEGENGAASSAGSSPENQPADASETTPLLNGDPNLPYGGQDDPATIAARWEEAVLAGKIQTTWQRETKTLVGYSIPLMVTFVLQYSLTVASVLAVGHIGTIELGAVSLASMTANITGYAIYQGLATSLDTLCAQAYGSGKKKLVGLQMQRAVLFLWTMTIPIAVIWLLADKVLMLIVPEKEVAILAGQYLKIVLAGAPGYACFECGKRYVQAQGLFSASLYVLLICAPANAIMNYVFVWVSQSIETSKTQLMEKIQHFGWGYKGAAIAVAITDNLLPFFLFLYVYFVAGRGCWPGFTKRSFQNWGPMVRLALPGLVMIEAETLAFEILTLASSYLGTEYLAAQSVLATIASLVFQLPFPFSIAASTRIANLIGATLPDAARTSVKVAFSLAVGVGVFNAVMLSGLKDHLPGLFTSDPTVAALVARTLPICAAFQLFDSLAATCNGILRGLGRQEIGGWVQLFSYYVVGLPISFSLAFKTDMSLDGLWAGVAIALGVVAVVEGVWIRGVDYDRSVEEARGRNDMS